MAAAYMEAAAVPADVALPACGGRTAAAAGTVKEALGSSDGSSSGGGGGRDGTT